MNPESNSYKYVLSVMYHRNRFAYFVGRYNLTTNSFTFSGWSSSFEFPRPISEFAKSGTYRNFQSVLHSHNKGNQIMIPITYDQANFLLDSSSHIKVQSAFPELFI